jgi:ABC-2 type transport system permease protein
VSTAFAALLRRDLYVATRQVPSTLAQMVLQPFFLLFVFGRVLTQLGYAQEGYADILLPGTVALIAVLAAMQSTALSLVIDFSFSKEIEDRLLAPLPTWLVAIEKVVFAAFQAVLAAAVMFPVGLLVLGSVPFRADGLPLLVAVLVLGALAGGAMGLTLGTLVPPNRINIAFVLVLTPLLFTGSSQYPWPSLDALPWFQVLTLFNPLTYASEGLRAALVPEVPHLSSWVTLPALAASAALFTATGIRGFLRRAMD